MSSESVQVIGPASRARSFPFIGPYATASLRRRRSDRQTKSPGSQALIHLSRARSNPYPLYHDTYTDRPPRKRTRVSSSVLAENLRRRREELENDPLLDATRLTAKSVWCVKCQKSIKLDARNDYYPGLWRKHRDAFHKQALLDEESQETGQREGDGKRENTTMGNGEVDEDEDKRENVPVIDEYQAALILTEMLKKFTSQL